MAWLFEYCTDGSTWVTIPSDTVPVDSLRHVSQRHRDLKPSTDTFEFDVLYPTTALLNAVMSSNAFEFRASLDSSAIFRGWVSTDAKIEVKSKIRIPLKAYDESWMMDRKLGSTINWQSYYVYKASDLTHSIVHQLMLLYGFSAGRILPTEDLTQIDYLVADSEERFDELVTQLLFELGWIYYFDESGNFKTETLFPADTSPTATFDDSNIYKPLTPDRKPVQRDGVAVTYWKHDTITDALVSEETTGGDEVNKCNVSIAAGEYYPVGSDTTDVYTDFRVADRELICALSPSVDAAFDSGITQSSPTFYPTKALVNFHNTSGAAKTLRQYDIIADAVVKGDKGIVRVYNRDESHADLFEVQARFLTTYDQAAYLCSGTALYYKYSSMTYPFRSLTKVAVGALVQLDDDFSGISQGCRVYARTTTWQLNGAELYEYALEGVREYTLQTTVVDGSHSQPPSLPRPQVQALEGALSRWDFLNGFVETGGTTTPTVPTIGAISGVYHGIAMLWDRQLNLSNFDHYEVQVSDDDGTHWYELVFDESDWKGTEDAFTSMQGEFLVHSGLSTETLQYRVRRVTRSGTASDWSDIAEATSSDTSNSTEAFNALYLNKIVVGQLQAVFAQITGELIVGASYQIGTTPPEGALKTIIQGGILANKEYLGGAWVTLVQVGGTDAARWYLQARGLIQVGVDPSITDMGDPMPSGFKRFKFDADYKDEAGSDPWTTKTHNSIVADSIAKRANVLALDGSSSTGELSETATNVWTKGNSCCIDLIHYCASPTGEFSIFYFSDGSVDVFGLRSDGNNNKIRAFVYKNGTVTYLDSGTVNLLAYNHISAGYDSASDKMYLVVNGVATQSGSAIGGAWGAGGSKKTAFFGVGVVARFSDALLKTTAMLDTTIAASIAKAQAHYASGQPWSYAAIDSRKDLLLIPATGGRVRIFGDYVDVAWRAVGAAGQPAFEHSWVNYGSTYASVSFRKDALGYVHLHGAAKSGTAGASVFTLPAGYRPLQDLVIPCALAAGTASYVIITSAGVVQGLAGAGNAGTWFDAVSFLAEQ
jgi:hypothetical protein